MFKHAYFTECVSTVSGLHACVQDKGTGRMKVKEVSGSEKDG